MVKSAKFTNSAILIQYVNLHECVCVCVHVHVCVHVQCVWCVCMCTGMHAQMHGWNVYRYACTNAWME